MERIYYPNDYVMQEATVNRGNRPAVVVDLEVPGVEEPVALFLSFVSFRQRVMKDTNGSRSVKDALERYVKDWDAVYIAVFMYGFAILSFVLQWVAMIDERQEDIPNNPVPPDNDGVNPERMLEVLRDGCQEAYWTCGLGLKFEGVPLGTVDGVPLGTTRHDLACYLSQEQVVERWLFLAVSQRSMLLDRRTHMIAQIGENGDTWLRKLPTCAWVAREMRRAGVDRRANVNDDVVEMEVVPDAFADDVRDEDVEREADGEENVKEEDSEEESVDSEDVKREADGEGNIKEEEDSEEESVETEDSEEESVVTEDVKREAVEEGNIKKEDSEEAPCSVNRLPEVNIKIEDVGEDASIGESKPSSTVVRRAPEVKIKMEEVERIKEEDWGDVAAQARTVGMPPEFIHIQPSSTAVRGAPGVKIKMEDVARIKEEDAGDVSAQIKMENVEEIKVENVEDEVLCARAPSAETRSDEESEEDVSQEVSTDVVGQVDLVRYYDENSSDEAMLSTDEDDSMLDDAGDYSSDSDESSVVNDADESIFVMEVEIVF